MNVGEMQRKLSLWAEQDKSHRFFDLYHLLHDNDWLRLAHDYVAQNAGSKTAGCDGINLKRFDEDLAANLQQLAQELKSETFQPSPVRRVYIPKPNGRYRSLGIPSIKDRIVQAALRMILEPIYEADFSQSSFGFRPNRCTMDAVKAAAMHTLGNQGYHWIIEGDVSAYFDTINHRRLLKILRQRIKDEKLLRLIWKFLRAGVMEGSLFRDTRLGTPQGGIVSPLLANIYLHELDKYMFPYTELSQSQRRQRRKQGLANYIYVRYADDFVVLCNGTRAQAEALREELYEFLKTLRLKLSKEKTQITHLNDGFNFLGFRIQRCRGAGRPGRRVSKILIPKAAVAQLRAKVAATTAKTTHQDSLNAKILALNRIVGGWCRYYQYTSGASSQFGKLRPLIFWRLAHWIGRKYDISMSEIMRKYCRESSLATAQYRLMMPDEIKTRRYTASTRKPNPYTTQQRLVREELLQQTYWIGHEQRPGMADLRPLVLERDGYICQICDKPVEAEVAEVDHIKPFKRFRRPVDANRLENLWTLCIACHEQKTKVDQQRESRMH